MRKVSTVCKLETPLLSSSAAEFDAHAMVSCARKTKQIPQMSFSGPRSNGRWPKEGSKWLERHATAVGEGV